MSSVVEDVLTEQVRSASTLPETVQLGAWQLAVRNKETALLQALVRRPDAAESILRLAAESPVDAVRATLLSRPDTPVDVIDAIVGPKPRVALLESAVRAGLPAGSPVLAVVADRLTSKPSRSLADAVVAAASPDPAAMGAALRVLQPHPRSQDMRLDAAVTIAANDAATAAWLADMVLASREPATWAGGLLGSPVLAVDVAERLVTEWLAKMAKSTANRREAPRTSHMNRRALRMALQAMTARGRELPAEVRTAAKTVLAGKSFDIETARQVQAFLDSATADPVILTADPGDGTRPALVAAAEVTTEDEFWAFTNAFANRHGYVDAVASIASRPGVGNDVAVAAVGELLEPAHRAALQGVLAARVGDVAFAAELYAEYAELMRIDRWALFGPAGEADGPRLLMEKLASMRPWQVVDALEALAQEYPAGHPGMLDAPWPSFVQAFESFAGKALGAALFAEQSAVFTDPGHWVAMTTLSDGFTGSVRELIRVSVAV